MMMENTQKNKTCKMCFEDIDARAKKCPHCQHWQKAYLLLGYHPVFVLLPFILVIILFAGSLRTIFPQGESFEGHETDLVILNSELKFGENDCGPTVLVLGTLINNGEHSWKDVKLDVRFNDAQGNMIDGEQDLQFGLEVPAGADVVFKTSMNREFPESQYSNFEIKVISARDARAWP